MTEQEAPAATEADEAERRLVDAIFGEGREPKEGNEEEIQEALNGILNEAQRNAALRIWAQSSGEYDAEEQARYGVNADGTIADGGLTDAGKEFAAYVVGEINEAFDERTTERKAERKAGRRQGADGSARLLVDALGLRDPLRAAIRAGALALAERLGDDEADDDGAGDIDEAAAHAHAEDGSCRHAVVLGGEPFVLLRANKVPGSRAGAITIVAGGGAYYASKGRREGGTLTVETMLDIAVAGVERYGEAAEPVMGMDDVKDMLREGFGIDFNGAARPGRQRGNGKGRGSAATEPGDAADSDVTASGPSTEAPGWGPPPSDDTPRTGESEPAPAKSGDDGGTSSPSSPSSGGGDASPSGTVPSGE